MRRVVYREVGGKRRRRAASPVRRSTSTGAGFGKLLSRLLSASLMLETSRPRRR